MLDWVTQVRRDQFGWNALFNCRTKAGIHFPVEMMTLAPDPNGLVVNLHHRPQRPPRTSGVRGREALRKVTPHLW
jgi:hypothetical protein